MLLILAKRVILIKKNKMPRIKLYIISYKAIIQLKRRNAIINLHSSFFGIEKTYRLIIYILPNS
jgi:hypothetical protein